MLWHGLARWARNYGEFGHVSLQFRFMYAFENRVRAFLHICNVFLEWAIAMGPLRLSDISYLMHRINHEIITTRLVPDDTSN